MIDVEIFYRKLCDEKIEFFTGVPDSLLKSFCAFVKDNVDNDKNIVAANEGNSIALATGYHLATGKIGLVYMQNSGIGNAFNPLTSLTDNLVYSIPMLLMIGWRGEPGKNDEPQHKKQGLITLDTLNLLGIKYEMLDEDSSNNECLEKIEKAKRYIDINKQPFAIIIKKGAFKEYKLKNHTASNYELTREDAIEVLLDNISNDSVIVSTTGMASREVFELREKRQEGHNKDFLTVGSMGHASQIALGIALNTDKHVYCIDGDGALIMHLGGLAIIANQKPKNLMHIVINNGAHDSVGGQATVGLDIDIPSIAMGCGYNKCYSCNTKEELIMYCQKIEKIEGPVLLEVKVKKGARNNLGRPTTTPIENKNEFMKFLR
ncbi:MAG: phosphonopyruvate decarboxylase [Clostridium sp.]|uniref:phosphonopyruvate decarboxylase n=1 Tax=Clostridium sp. TaxID=1506 RepID=UPI0029007FF3|nr:phosphonopyruvate decarboxylase [Clostridium sp.]MDU1978914.1 phosphonopyruvate decarboxylase [Clostridium sp.]MDU1994344.1 phosphonopyruvate decarboxylase [Clostridium sp.]MDU6048923.1 phosphonopyruvate decarboxylase [Clostridium sp.]MDU6223040.1 phosphonopyruvate decarboxylase [Clostridium sp.]MDU6273813.1 phosphonopyruvate decarboxylase [Clostridium sp.]